MVKAEKSSNSKGDVLQSIDLPRDRMQELFVPIHEYVELYPEEIAIIDLPAFQRLRRCRQLGFAHLLFPGAAHTRFEHSIGTLHVAQRIMTYINKNFARGETDGFHFGGSAWRIGSIDEPTQMFIRLASLLHDIGHVPFGHTLEDELSHLDKHDGPTRIRRIAQEVAEGYQVNPELYLELERPTPGWSLASLVDQAYRPYREALAGDTEKIPSPFEILELIISKPPTETSATDVWNARIEQAEEFIPIKTCCDIVGNTICADFLDYLFRDWYHLGKILNEDPRLY